MTAASPISERRAAPTDDLERHWRSCYRVALAVVHDPARAEDAAQEAFAELMALGAPPENTGAWLRGTALNKARMQARGEGRRATRERVVGARRWQASAREAQSLARLDELTKDLPEKLRLPIELHYGLGHTQAEIAALLEVPTGTVASRLRRGLDRIRERLAGRGQVLAVAAVGSLIASAYRSLQRTPAAPAGAAAAGAAATQVASAPAGAGAASSAGAKKLAGAHAAAAVAGAVSLLVAALLLLGRGPKPAAPPRPLEQATRSVPTAPVPALAPRPVALDEAPAPSRAESAPAGSPAPAPAVPPAPLVARPLPLGQLHHPGAQHLAVAPGEALCATASGERIAVWDPVRRELLCELRPPGDWRGVGGLAFLSGEVLAATVGDRLHVWQARSGVVLGELPASGGLATPAAPDGRSVILLGETPEVLDVFQGARRPATPADTGQRMRLRPDPRRDASLLLERWEEDDGWWQVCNVPFEGDSNEVLGLTVDPDGGRAWLALGERLVAIDLETGGVVAEARASGGRQVILAGAGKSATLVAPDLFGLGLRDPEMLEEIARIEGDGQLSGIALLADGRTLVGAGTPSLRVWDLVEKRELTPVGREVQAPVQHVLAGPGGELVSVDRAGQVAFWDAAGQLVRTVGLPFPSEEELDESEGIDIPFEDPGLAWYVASAAWGPDALWLVATSFQEDEQSKGSSLHRIDAGGRYLGRVAWPGELADALVWQAALSPDGRRLAVGVEGGLRILSLPGLTPLSTARFPAGDEVTFSGDGRRLALKTGPAEVSVFDAVTGELLGKVGAGVPVKDVCLGWGFSEEDLEPIELVGIEDANAPDSPHSVVDVTLTADGTVALLALAGRRTAAWDVKTGKELWTSPGHCVAVTPDGAAVLVGEPASEKDESQVVEVRLLDLRTGKQRGPLLLGPSIGDRAWCATLLSGGRLVAGTANGWSGGGSVVIWDLPPR